MITLAAKPAETAISPAQARFPRHIAIIMDGNSRWAKAHGTSRKAGHKKGSETLKALLEQCQNTGIEVVTVYAFSSENWKRPQTEVSDLMELLRFYLRHEVARLHRDGVRIRFIGDRSLLSEDIRQELTRTEALTENNQRLTLVIALSYGSRQEMIRSVRDIAQAAKDGRLQPDDITEETMLHYLDTADIAEPDLLIRTGGEQRLSNFLLWQSAYTELYFTQILWPDFTFEHLQEAIREYQQRERRFGARSEE